MDAEQQLGVAGSLLLCLGALAAVHRVVNAALLYHRTASNPNAVPESTESLRRRMWLLGVFFVSCVLVLPNVIAEAASHSLTFIVFESGRVLMTAAWGGLLELWITQLFVLRGTSRPKLLSPPVVLGLSISVAITYFADLVEDGKIAALDRGEEDFLGWLVSRLVLHFIFSVVAVLVALELRTVTFLGSGGLHPTIDESIFERSIQRAANRITLGIYLLIVVLLTKDTFVLAARASNMNPYRAEVTIRGMLLAYVVTLEGSVLLMTIQPADDYTKPPALRRMLMGGSEERALTDSAAEGEETRASFHLQGWLGFFGIPGEDHGGAAAQHPADTSVDTPRSGTRDMLSFLRRRQPRSPSSFASSAAGDTCGFFWRGSSGEELGTGGGGRHEEMFHQQQQRRQEHRQQRLLAQQVQEQRQRWVDFFPSFRPRSPGEAPTAAQGAAAAVAAATGAVDGARADDIYHSSVEDAVSSDGYDSRDRGSAVSHA